MTVHKIPGDAFAYYVALGQERSYEAVAKRYGVSKRGVTKCAAKHRWSERLTEVEKDAQERLDKRLAGELEEQRMRHAKLLRAVAARAGKAIAEYPLTDGMQGIKAAEIAIKLERLLSGEPSERTEVAVAAKLRHEAERFLRPAGEKPTGDDDW